MEKITITFTRYEIGQLIAVLGVIRDPKLHILQTKIHKLWLTEEKEERAKEKEENHVDESHHEGV